MHSVNRNRNSMKPRLKKPNNRKMKIWLPKTESKYKFRLTEPKLFWLFGSVFGSQIFIFRLFGFLTLLTENRTVNRSFIYFIKKKNIRCMWHYQMKISGAGTEDWLLTSGWTLFLLTWMVNLNIFNYCLKVTHWRLAVVIFK